MGSKGQLGGRERLDLTLIEAQLNMKAGSKGQCTVCKT